MSQNWFKIRSKWQKDKKQMIERWGKIKTDEAKNMENKELKEICRYKAKLSIEKNKSWEKLDWAEIKLFLHVPCGPHFLVLSTCNDHQSWPRFSSKLKMGFEKSNRWKNQLSWKVFTCWTRQPNYNCSKSLFKWQNSTCHEIMNECKI